MTTETDKAMMLVSDGNVRLAIIGESSTGKSSFVEAMLPQGIPERVSCQDGIARADAVILVHRLSCGGLSDSEAEMVRTCLRGNERGVVARFFAVGTFVDVCDPDVVAEAYGGMVSSLGALVGHHVPVFAVAPPLWSLARREQMAGREIAAKCFRESSGMLPVIDHIRALTGRLPAGHADVPAREVAARAMRLIGEALMLSARRLEANSEENGLGPENPSGECLS